MEQPRSFTSSPYWDYMKKGICPCCGGAKHKSNQNDIRQILALKYNKTKQQNKGGNNE
ncbi:MAG: hypothetical protein IJF92_00665 [Bacilli bacterium]|nr:hypothetical protein [Bacilli bacterium]MBQ3307674.1 hypothetical protein [Bacilli bacterium]